LAAVARRILERVRAKPWLVSIAISHMLRLMNIRRGVHYWRAWRGVISSCVVMVALMGSCGLRP